MEEVGVDEVAVKTRTRVDYQVIDVIARRWSPFAFDPERDVPESSVRSMLEAARWAPSARNEQPWRFLVIDRSAADARAKIESCLSEGNAWAKRAPLFLMAVAKTDYSANPEPNPWHRYDVGAAVLSAILQATAMGLSARQIGAYDKPKAAGLLGIPAGFEPATLVAIGYFGGVENVTEAQREHDVSAPRLRRPQSEFAFKGVWGNTFD